MIHVVAVVLGLLLASIQRTEGLDVAAIGLEFRNGYAAIGEIKALGVPVLTGIVRAVFKRTT